MVAYLRKIGGFFIKKFCLRVAKNDSATVFRRKNRDKHFFENVDFVNSTLGDFSYVARNSIIHNTEIGKFCSIGPNVVIGYGDHPLKFLSSSPVFYTEKLDYSIFVDQNYFDGHKKVIIKNDVWIGAGVFVKNGVTIGNGAIIGAHSVILKDVEPYTINVGSPSRVTSYRFSKDIIDKLQKIEWWNLSNKTILSNIELFTTDVKLEDRLSKIQDLMSLVDEAETEN